MCDYNVANQSFGRANWPQAKYYDDFNGFPDRASNIVTGTFERVPKAIGLETQLFF